MEDRFKTLCRAAAYRVHCIRSGAAALHGFVRRWFISRHARIPAAFHLAFLRRLELIREQDHIRQQWWAARNASSAPQAGQENETPAAHCKER